MITPDNRFPQCIMGFEDTMPLSNSRSKYISLVEISLILEEETITLTGVPTYMKAL